MFFPVFRLLFPLALFPLTAPLVAQVVSLTAPTPSATEAGVYPGVFRLARTGDTSQPLTVALAYAGTGVAGDDYERLPATVVIPSGQASADVILDPINDPQVEAAADTVIATVQAGVGYTVGSPASATVTLTDDERFTNTAPFLYSAAADSPTSIQVRWLDNFETETKYRVQYRFQGDTTWITIDNLPPNTTSRQVTGLVSGLTYEFRVVAFQNTTSSAVASPASAVCLAPASPAPAFVTFEEWRNAKGLAGALRASAGRTTDDPDGDGRVNLLEYLASTDPLASDAGGLALAPAPGSGLSLQWAETPDLLDGSLVLEETTSLANAVGWGTSPLVSTASAGIRSAADPRTGAARFYRLKASPSVPVTPSSVITCWGDSLTGNPGTYATKLPALLAGNRIVRNGGIGGDISSQIGDRMRGLTITSPYPAFSASTAAGTSVRVVASRSTHARIMSTSQRGNWATYAATLANVSRVEFFNLGRKIGESSSPLASTVSSNRAANASRLLAPGHPFANGDVVHFPAGPLPSPLVVGKTYYVRGADSGGFSLAEADVQFAVTASSTTPSTRFVSAGHPFVDGHAVWFRDGAAPPGLFADRLYSVRDADTGGFALAAAPGGTAISMVYTYSGAIMGPPGAPLSLAADFAAATVIRGPFIFPWTHPGGPTSLTLRTHTDRDADTVIFWMGRNNSARPHETYAELHAAIEHIKALNSRFLIVSVTNGGGESAGSSYYYNVINLNHVIRKEFPDAFVDVRTALIRAASADANDQLDRAADIPPRSLRSDAVHFNDAGHQLIAELLAAELTLRGW